jgi:hypothetical protein
MIKFFRHIRKNLLSEGKNTKYFKYAIGEIVLVVIGILIALSINNWNENRKNRIEETALLTQLKSEFESNLDQLDEKIAIRNDMINASLTLLDYVDDPSKRNNDTIIKHITFTTLAPTFDPIVNDLNGSGNIQLLSNKKLKQLLSIWTSELVQITEEEVAWITFRDNLYYPFLIEQNSIRNLLNGYWLNNTLASFHLDKETNEDFNIGNSKSISDPSKILDIPAMESHLSLCATFSKLTNSQSQTLRKRIVEILDILNNELNVDD